MAFTGTRNFVHDAEIVLAVGPRLADQMTARPEQAADAERQFVNCRFHVVVLVEQHFALLGKLELTAYRAGRLRQDGFVSRAAAAAQCTASAVEHTAGNAGSLGYGNDALLRVVKTPGRGQYAAVLAGIGIAEHHFLALALGIEQMAVNRQFVKLGQNCFDAMQIVNGFKQRRYADVAIPIAGQASGQSCLRGKQHDFHDMRSRMRHRDDVFAKTLRPQIAAGMRDELEQTQGFTRGRRQAGKVEMQCVRIADGFAQEFQACALIQRQIVDIQRGVHHLGHRLTMAG